MSCYSWNVRNVWGLSGVDVNGPQRNSADTARPNMEHNVGRRMGVRPYFNQR